MQVLILNSEQGRDFSLQNYKLFIHIQKKAVKRIQIISEHTRPVRREITPPTATTKRETHHHQKSNYLVCELAAARRGQFWGDRWSPGEKRTRRDEGQVGQEEWAEKN